MPATTIHDDVVDDVNVRAGAIHHARPAHDELRAIKQRLLGVSLSSSSRSSSLRPLDDGHDDHDFDEIVEERGRTRARWSVAAFAKHLVAEYVDSATSAIMTAPPSTSAGTAANPSVSTITSIRIAVGSMNGAKLRSVQMAADKLLGQNGSVRVEVAGCNVDSGVSHQPMSDAETMEGAVQRARNALREDPEASYAVGLEGGAQKVGERWFECGWIAVVDRAGKLGLGSSGRYELSPKIMKRLMGGVEELAQVIDDLSGQCDVRSSHGAMGILTNGHCPRDAAYEHGVLFAFAPFVSPSVYWE